MNALFLCFLLFAPALVLGIFNGKPTSIANYPHTVQLKSKAGDRDVFMCGGSLITKTHVLTGGRCCPLRAGKVSYKPMSVVYGSTNLLSSEAKEVKVKKYVLDSRFQNVLPEMWVEHDMCVVELVEEVDMSVASTIELVKESDTSVLMGKRGSLPGWGARNREGSKWSKEQLYEGKFDIVSSEAFHQSAPQSKVFDYETFAESFDDFGNGDFGQGLVVSGSQNKKVLFGIASTKPIYGATAYSRVGAFKEFIEANAPGVTWYEGGFADSPSTEPPVTTTPATTEPSVSPAPDTTTPSSSPTSTPASTTSTPDNSSGVCALAPLVFLAQCINLMALY